MLRAPMKPHAFQVHPNDNVATLLDDGSGTVEVLGVQPQEVRLLEKISSGHKVALKDFTVGEAVIKLGARIGHATQPIARGAWVHLHNLVSEVDDRSGTLDLHSGVPMDTNAAYV